MAPFWDVPSLAPCSVSPAPPSGSGRVPSSVTHSDQSTPQWASPLPSTWDGTFYTISFCSKLMPSALYCSSCVWSVSQWCWGAETRPLVNFWNIAVYPKVQVSVPSTCMGIGIFKVSITNLSHWTQWVERSPNNPLRPYYSETHFTGEGPHAFTNCVVGLQRWPQPLPLTSLLRASAKQRGSPVVKRWHLFLSLSLSLNLSWPCNLLWPKNIAKSSKSSDSRVILRTPPPYKASHQKPCLLPH